MSEQIMDVYISVFNCHVNNAKDRVIESFKLMYSEGMFQKHIAPFVEKGLMSLFDSGNKSPFVISFVTMIWMYVNENYINTTCIHTVDNVQGIEYQLA